MDLALAPNSTVVHSAVMSLRRIISKLQEKRESIYAEFSILNRAADERMDGRDIVYKTIEHHENNYAAFGERMEQIIKEYPGNGTTTSMTSMTSMTDESTLLTVKRMIEAEKFGIEYQKIDHINAEVKPLLETMKEMVDKIDELAPILNYPLEDIGEYFLRTIST
jgi:hypothetical protein